MRAPLARRCGLLALLGALVAPLSLQPARGAPPPRVVSEFEAVPSLAPEVVTAALEAPGRVVRKTERLTVERVLIPTRGEGPSNVYRVTVEGRFRPRALRYVVLAGGRPIGYGTPTAGQRSVQAVTVDPAVRTATVVVRYEGGGPPGAVLPGRVRGDGNPPPEAESRVSPRVTRAVYNLGEEAFRPSELRRKVELIADVHYPTGLPAGPYPLVLFMHGNHSSCYRGSRSGFAWPCPRRWKPLPNYAGYDYIAERLAKHGFIVVSVSANGVNVLGSRLNDTGMRQRGEVIEKHIDLWRRWSTVGGGPFGDTFVGKVDLSLIGTMGHSRGGEGVVWNKIVDEERADPYGIDAVLALAPVDFTRVTINETAFAVVLPYCDGDVYDLQGVHFFDDSRYLVPGDPTPKHTVTAFGANHNFFNTVWSPSSGFPGAFDDGRWSDCRDRLGEWQQRRVGSAYITSFFRRYLAGELAFDDWWTGAKTPGWIEPARTLVSYLAPDTPEHRMDLGRFTDEGDLSISEVGGAVVSRRMSLYGWCRNTSVISCVPGDLRWKDIHYPGLSRALLGWSGRAGRVRFEIPAGRGDVEAFDSFQFRAVPNPGYSANRGIKYQDVAVVLVDAEGNRARLLASEVGREALAYPLTRDRRASGHVILNQVRFPLTRFEGVDLSNVRAVELRFSRTRAGVIDVADVAFSRGGS